MQTYFLKFLKIFIFLFIVFTQALDSQGQTSLNKKADSLFIQKKIDEARNIYDEIIENNINVNPKIYLKLANISETKAEFVKELFYLNLYFFKKPDEKVFEKMYNIASENGFSGYEKNDLNVVKFLFQHGKVRQAIEWARELEENSSGATPANACPTTRVYVLVERLLDYVKHDA
jgi:tetratricopeptide (TPR) repeat protein